MVIWMTENVFQMTLEPYPKKCGTSGAEITYFFNVYTNSKKNPYNQILKLMKLDTKGKLQIPENCVRQDYCIF
jgi:hypothetical protein